MNTQHTPGEWKPDYNEGPDLPIWNERECIATVWASPQSSANAKLIAAAPDLLNALNEIVELFPAIEGKVNTLSFMALVEWNKRAKKAIAKATN